MLSNVVVNEVGFTFVQQLRDETGASISDIIKAYVISRGILSLEKHWQQIESLDNKILSQVQMELMAYFNLLARRMARWFLRNRRSALDIATLIENFKPEFEYLAKELPLLLTENSQQVLGENLSVLDEKKVPHDIAQVIAEYQFLNSALDIIDAAQLNHLPLVDVARVYFNLSDYLELNWMREQLNNYVAEDAWAMMAREACKDDLDWQQRNLSVSIIRAIPEESNVAQKIEKWSKLHPRLLQRWNTVLLNLKGNISANMIMFVVATRELMDII